MLHRDSKDREVEKSLHRGQNLVPVVNDVIRASQKKSRDFLRKSVAFWDFLGLDAGFL